MKLTRYHIVHFAGWKSTRAAMLGWTVGAMTGGMGRHMKDLPENAQSYQKTLKGFTVARRCEVCGRKTNIATDDGDSLILRCQTCGKEYKFYLTKETMV